jgi:hypothetical protein
MGAGIAASHLRAGLSLMLVDVNAEALAAAVPTILDEAAWNRAAKRSDAALAVQVAGRLRTAQGMAAIAAADFVIESVTERPDVKQQVLTEIERMVGPATVITTARIEAMTQVPIAFTLRFDPAGIRLYPDRPGRYALTGSAAAIGAPGQYATAGPGRAIVWARPGGTLMIGNGRGGFDLNGRSHIAITGFVFRHQTAASDGRTEGAAITRAGRQGSGLVIDGNRFENSSLWDGKGVITLSHIDDVKISNNSIAGIERGSGMRMGANTSRVVVTGNRIDRVGRTGIAFLGASDSRIADNVITNLRGVHGNGISLYLNNRGVTVVNNRILETDRPMTFRGDAKVASPGDHGFTIERNIFIATSTAQAALTSWGANTRDVTIRNNVLIAPRGGLLANGSDTGVTIADNYLSGIIFHRGQGAGWTVADNRTADASLRITADTTADRAELCNGAGVAAGSMLGGTRC